MAREKGLSVDESGFNEAMDAQKQRAKATGKFAAESSDLEWEIVSEGKDSEFKGYETTTADGQIRRYAVQGDDTLVILDQTPFYAESGGQIGDTGTIKGDGVDLSVYDVKKDGDSFIHYCGGSIGSDGAGPVSCKVDSNRRQNIRKNHTATHLMHKALKTVLGDHVQQAGSLVHPDYLRFDLTHFEKISPEEIREIEKLVYIQVLINKELSVSVKSFDDAKKEGAVAMFGEKYGDEVRVITVGDFSKELCGGTFFFCIIK